MSERQSRAVGMHAEGVPVAEIASALGVAAATVYRWVAAARDGDVGPVERSVAAVIAARGDLSVREDARAEMLRACATIVDRAAAAKTGVAWGAGVQALDRLWRMAEEFAPDESVQEKVRELFLDAGIPGSGGVE